MGQCIFCRKISSITKEHIFADWLKQYIPKDIDSYLAADLVVNNSGAPDTIREKKIGGDPRSKRVLCVCQPCNNVWMSRLQEDAKPIVLPLILGQPTQLSVKDRKVLSAWIAMSVMCAEFGSRDRVAIAQRDRDILFQHKVPPKNNWRIWIAHYKRGAWKPHFIHHALPIVKEKVVKRPLDGKLTFNTQSTTYVVGELYIHAISSVWPRCVRLMRLVTPASIIMREIWPADGPPLDWPPPRPLTDHEADFLAGAFFNNLRIKAGLISS